MAIGDPNGVFWRLDTAPLLWVTLTLSVWKLGLTPPPSDITAVGRHYAAIVDCPPEQKSVRNYNFLYSKLGIGKVRLFSTAPRIRICAARRLSAAIWATSRRVAFASKTRTKPSVTCPKVMASAYRLSGGASTSTKSNSFRNSVKRFFSRSEVSRLGASTPMDPHESREMLRTPSGFVNDRMGPS